MSQQLVENASNISIHFTLTLADGTPVDGTVDGQPMEFTIGDGTMIAAFEETILGMAVGEKRQVSLEPRETFGFADEANYHWIEKEKFEHIKSDDLPQQVEVGSIIGFDAPSGEKIPGTILQIADDKIQVDFNHPLCGLELIFTVELVSIKP